MEGRFVFRTSFILICTVVRDGLEIKFSLTIDVFLRFPKVFCGVTEHANLCVLVSIVFSKFKVSVNPRTRLECFISVVGFRKFNVAALFSILGRSNLLLGALRLLVRGGGFRETYPVVEALHS